jgi:hypothetical protein
MKPASWLLALLLALFAGIVGATTGGEVARLGMYMPIARDLSRLDTRTALEVWAEELTSRFQVPTHISFYDDVNELRRDFDAGKVNLVVADAMTFVRHFKEDELADGFTAKLQADASLQLLAKPGIGKPELAGRKIAVIEGDEISNTYLETLCLRQYGRDCASVIGAIVPVANTHRAVTRLFFNQVDFALVNRHGMETAKEMNPQLGKAGEIVDQLYYETYYFGFFSQKVSPSFRRFALRTIPEVHLNPRGKQLLDVFKTDRMAFAEPAMLKPFYALERDYRALKSRKPARAAKK